MALSRSQAKLHTGVRFEWPMILLSLVLWAIGLAVIYSATAPLGDSGRAFVVKQITWCSFGLVLMAAFMLFDYHLLDRWAVAFYVAVVGALALAWMIGKVAAGSQRWIEIGFMRIQPSEFAKLAVVVILAKYYHDRSGREDAGPIGLAIPILLTLIPAALVLIQPDLGTATVIVLIAASMIAFAGMGLRTFLWVGGAIACITPILYLLSDQLLLDYQKRRLLTYLDPGYDPLGSGYHVIQSQIAIGSGGAFGKGFLQGTQNQLMFLPVKHTDFVFSVLAEEWGFLGSLAVLVLFSALLMRGLSVCRHARDNFGLLLAFGCTVMFFWHVAVNVGMVTGLLPVVGVPLSFMSYGGSSLLSSFLAVAVVANVSMRRFSY